MPSHDIKPVEVFVDTPDGWRLAAYRYFNDKCEHPVLLVHGMGSNRHDLDFPDPRLSLARALHQKGFDVWVLELRGAGKSQPLKFFSRLYQLVRPTWTFDDHVLGDIPVFLDHIRKTTGKKSFHWVGHSLGGVVVYAAVGVYGSKVCQSAVTIGAAMNSHAKPGFARVLIKIEDRFLRLFPLIPGGTIARLGYGGISYLAFLLDNFYYCMDNLERRTIRLALRYAAENISIPLFLQMHRWYQENDFSSLDRRINYHRCLKKIRSPWLTIAGSVDGMTPLPDVFFGYEQVGSTEKEFMVFGKEFGHQTDYGHLDLVVGRHAPREVYPAVLAWLRRFDSGEAKLKKQNKGEKNVTSFARYRRMRIRRDTHGGGAPEGRPSGTGD